MRNDSGLSDSDVKASFEINSPETTKRENQKPIIIDEDIGVDIPESAHSRDNSVVGLSIDLRSNDGSSITELTGDIISEPDEKEVSEILGVQRKGVSAVVSKGPQTSYSEFAKEKVVDISK